jgi:hypothetical protein
MAASRPSEALPRTCDSSMQLSLTRRAASSGSVTSRCTTCRSLLRRVGEGARLCLCVSVSATVSSVSVSTSSLSAVGDGILYGSEVAASCTAGGVSVTCGMLTRDTLKHKAATAAAAALIPRMPHQPFRPRRRGSGAVPVSVSRNSVKPASRAIRTDLRASPVSRSILRSACRCVGIVSPSASAARAYSLSSCRAVVLPS